MHRQDYWPTLQRARLTRRRLFAASGVAGVGLAGLGVLGCGGKARTARQAAVSGTQPAQQTPQAGGTVSFAVLGNPPSLDIQRISSTFTGRPMSLVTSRLFRFQTAPDAKVSENWDIEGELGTSAESPDAVTWTAKLRADATFHNLAPVNGHPVEAEDVKATFTRAVNPGNPTRGLLDMVDPAQIETPAKDTIVFKLKYPYAPFSHILASPNCSMILPREALAGSYDPAKQAIGSGPFVFDSYTPDVALIAKKNSAYFEKGRPLVDAVRWSVVPDANQQMAQFAGGNVDWIEVQTLHDRDTVKRSVPRASATAGKHATDVKIFFQLGDPLSPFQDIRVRRAISLAMDRDGLTRALYDNESVPGFAIPSYMGKWALSIGELPPETAQWYKFDPAKAKQLLAEAGHSSLELKIADPTSYPGGPIYQKIVEALPAMLQAIGIKSAIVPLDYQREWLNGGRGVFYGDFKADMIVPVFYPTSTDPDQFFYTFYYSKGSGNLGHLADSTLDAMMDKSRTLVNDSDRLKATKDIQKYMADKMYTVAGLPSGYAYEMTQPWVRNFNYPACWGWGTESFAKLSLQK